MNISIKNIKNCNNFDNDKLTTVANKLGINVSDDLNVVANKKKVCNSIKKKYYNLNPCGIILYDNTELTIKKHQISVANHLVNSRGAIVVHSVGTGKTLTAIATAQCLLLNNIINKVIVVTPTSLQTNFIDQMKMYGIDDKIINSKYTFYTIQGIVNSIESGKVVNPAKSLIIIDEAHNLRKLESSRFDSIYKYSKKAMKILLLTATPLINYEHDIINLISIIKNTNPIGMVSFNNMITSGNSKIIKEYLEDVFSFYIRDKPNSNFPSKKILEIFLPMDRNYYKIYLDVEKGLVKKIPDFRNKNIHVFYNGLRRASNIIDKKSPKVEWIIKKIKSEPKAKYVIFSNFITMGITPIIKWLEAHNIHYDNITGDQSIEERQVAVSNYNSGKHKILFITKAGSEGLDLKNTTYIIIMESSWNENVVEQIIGRGVRYKSHTNLPISKQHVTIYKLLCVKPTEYSSLDKITKKYLLEYKNEPLSIDLYLRNYAWLKQQRIITFYKLLEKYKII
jgi:superfamily II DNA or RNA helicase